MRNLILLFCFFISISTSCQETVYLDSVSISVQKNFDNHEVTLLLIGSKKKIDSISFKNVDMSFDSLVKVNDSLYHYIFSETLYSFNGRNISKNQVLVDVSGGELRVLFAGIYEYSFMPKDRLESKDDGSFWEMNYKLNFDSLDHNVLSVIHSDYTINRLDGHITFDTTTTITYLNFDTLSRVYYSELKILDGLYEYNQIENKSPEGFSRVMFENELVPVIKVGSFEYFYYKGYWFYKTSLENTFTAFRKLELEK